MNGYGTLNELVWHTADIQPSSLGRANDQILVRGNVVVFSSPRMETTTVDEVVLVNNSSSLPSSSANGEHDGGNDDAAETQFLDEVVQGIVPDVQDPEAHDTLANLESSNEVGTNDDVTESRRGKSPRLGGVASRIRKEAVRDALKMGLFLNDVVETLKAGDRFEGWSGNGTIECD